MPIKITNRDIEILKWIAKLKHLSTTQIAEFFFNGKIKVARRRLKRLVDSGYLCWFEKSDADACGRMEHVFYLNKKRAEDLKCLLGTENINFYSIPKNPLFANHDLEVARIILCLKTRCEKGQEYSFDCYVNNRSKFIRRGQDKQTRLPLIGRNKAVFIPDALVVLHGKSGKSLLFLEIDTGKEVISGSFRNTADITQKLKAYMDYQACKGYKDLSDEYNFPFKGFRVLFVTTPGRTSKIHNLCDKIDTHGIVWITSFDQVKADSIFNPIWQVPCTGKDEARSIIKNH